MHKLKSILILVVVLLLISSAVYYKYEQVNYNASNQSEKIVTLKIAYLPITHALPLFKTKELLESQGNVRVELVKYGGWSELMDALNTGRVDGASVLIEMAMKAKEQGIPLELVALGHRDGNVVITSNNITSPEELRGKTFAIPNIQSSHYILLQQLLKNSNIDLSEIKVVEMAPAEMPAALQSGQIDGYCVAEPFGAKAVSAGIGRVFVTSKDLWQDSICCGIVMNSDAIKNKKDAVHTFEQAFKQAGNNLTEQESEKIAEKYLNQNSDISKLSLQWISFKNLNVSDEAYESLIEKIKDFGLSKNPPAYKDFVAEQN